MHNLHTFEYRLNRRGKGKIKKYGANAPQLRPILKKYGANAPQLHPIWPQAA